MLIKSLLYFCFVHSSLLIPGYVLIRKSRLLVSKPEFELGLAYAAALVLYGLMASITYALKINELIPQMIFWVLFFYTCFIFFSHKIYIQLRDHLLPLASLLLISAFSLAFIGLTFARPYTIIPDPEPRTDRNYTSFNIKVLNVAKTGANDNYIPYRQAQFFINRSDPAKDSFIGEWGVHFFQRTPLMGAVSANYFTALNDSLPIGYTWSNDSVDPGQTYQKFQIIAQILNSLFVIPAFYLLTRLFSRRTAVLSMIFIIPNQFFLYNSFFSWPKSLVAFFILLSWTLLMEKGLRYVLLAGSMSGIAYLTHDLAVLYIAASFLLLVSQKRFRDSIIFSAIAFLFALPWFIISSLIYKKQSSFFLYPISTKGIPQPDQKAMILQEFKQTPILRLITIRLESLFYLMSPYQLIYSEGGQAIGRRIWALGLYSIPGSLGLGLVIPFVIGAVKKLKDRRFWILVLVPILASTIVIGWPRGFGSLHFAEATVVLLTGLACSWLAALKRSVWAIAAYAACSAQTLFFISYSYFNDTEIWLRQPGDIVRAGFMLAVVVLCGAGAYRVVSSHSPQKISA